jgi:hypothetical protein
MVSIDDITSMFVQPLRASEAKRHARHILLHGEIFFTRHAMRELAKDDKTTFDAANVIRAGMYGEAEWEHGAWRHQASTQRFTVVVEIESERRLIVVTGWSKK